jgi:UDP-N-acetyl-D-glucosamine dehydrogenase
VPVIPDTRQYKALAGRRSQAWDEIDLASYDAVLIATDHDGVDYVELAKARLVIDTRNACRRAGVVGAHIIPA